MTIGWRLHSPKCIGRRNRCGEKPMSSALDTVSLKFLCRAAWRQMSRGLQGTEVSRLEMYIWRDELCMPASLKSFANATCPPSPFSKKEILILPPHKRTMSATPSRQAYFSSKGTTDASHSNPGETHWQEEEGIRQRLKSTAFSEWTECALVKRALDKPSLRV